MTPGQFIETFAALARIEEKTLSLHVRMLREAGRVQKSGRGRSAIEVDHAYLAAVLISRMATDKPSRAVEAYDRFAGMQLLNDRYHEMVESVLPNPDHTLSEFMIAICDPAHDMCKGGEFEITFRGTAMVDVDLEGRTLTYINRQEMAEHCRMIANASGDTRKEDKIRGLIFHSDSSLQGIVECRQFAASWLEMVKEAVLRQSAAFIEGVGK